MALAFAILAVVLGVFAIFAWARGEKFARRVERLTRQAARDAAEVDRLRRADAAVMERLPDPVLVLDAARAVLRANHAAQAAFGAEMGAVLRHPGLRAAIEHAFTAGAPESADLSLPVPVPREVRGTVVPLDPPLADGGRALVVLSDRTRERAVERMRADFVANASHELRTPLASLVGFIETLRGPAADDPPAQRRFLAIMAGQAARMNRLIDDLLSLSRIELVEHEAPAERVALAPLLEQVVAGFAPPLAGRGVRLDVAIAPGLPAVAGDADQLAQVVQNLLDNAMKYGVGADGTAALSLAAMPVSGGHWPARPGVVLTVGDRGAGIPRAHLPRLTERFYRVDTGRSRAAGGTGLGLAIVRHIVNRHRGQLAIDSEEGAGTTVSVWLPAAGGTPGGAVEPASGAPGRRPAEIPPGRP
ncbi:MAG: ATP-binding protein [Acetobacteraceae bacterium]